MRRIEPLIEGDADEQAWQSASHFQLSEEDRVSPEEIVYCNNCYSEPLPLTVSDLYQDMSAFSVSAFKDEIDHLDWESQFPAGLQTSDPVALSSNLEVTRSPPTPNSSSSESQCPQDYPSSLIQGSFFGEEHSSLTQHYTGNKSIKKDGEVSILPKPAAHCRKRSVEKAFSSDEVDIEGARARQKAKTDADSNTKTRRQLACPFQKLDSHKHHECLKYALHRIKDVKQHIYRRHKQPDYYCARCFEVFKNGQARDDHARTAHCSNKDTPGFEGISDEQRTQLNKGSCRALDIQGKWFEIWDIIFPGQKRPSSPWVGSYLEEMAPLLRSLWKNKSSEILNKALTKDQARTLDRGILDGVVKSVFDCLEVETSASLGKNANGICSQEQIKLSDAQSPTSTPHSSFMNDSIYPFMLDQSHGDFPLEGFQTEDVFRTI